MKNGENCINRHTGLNSIYSTYRTFLLVKILRNLILKLFIMCYSILFVTSMGKFFKAIFSTSFLRKKLTDLPVHDCRTRVPGRSRLQSPVRWARKRRTDSNRSALVATAVSVRISHQPAACTQPTTSPWRSCRRRRMTTTSPTIIPDGTSNTEERARRWRSMRFG